MNFLNDRELILLQDIKFNQDNNIKESRIVRKKQIELDNIFHKKNPKSTNPQKMPKNMNSEKNKDKSNAKKKLEDKEDNIKLRNNCRLIYDSLLKRYKKDLFFNNSKGYEKIFILKDFLQIKTTIHNKQCSLNIRVKIGEYNLKNAVMKYKTNFSSIKSDFEYWYNNQSNNINPKEILDNQISSLFSLYKDNPDIAPFLPSLRDNIIRKLRKTRKQTFGFIEVLEQIKHSWLEEAKEISYIEEIEKELNLSSYEETFPLARNLNRKIKIFIGPTNSGKTYAALNLLAQAPKGIYLAPLRLMAHEGKDSLLERNIIANLITGEERIEIVGATHTSSTVEMCNLNQIVDVAVIDEIQMIADESRGWAWSQSLIGVPAKEVVLVGSEEALPYIIPVIENLNEEYEIVRFERKNELKQVSPITNLKSLKPGDCVVVFSRKNALEMKNSVEATGKKCSIIYGNLSPEVRKKEAEKFKNGENPILIATDAIGMGLNLPINRLFFSTLEKYDGISSRLLSISEIKQIAGRAGRYGFSTHGEVGLLFNTSSIWRNLLNRAIHSGYEENIDNRISIAPNLKQIQTICHTLEKEDLYAALIFFKEKLIKDHPLYKAANLENMIDIARLIRNRDMDLSMRLNYACLPIDITNDTHMKYFFIWLNSHLSNKTVTPPSLPDVISHKRSDNYSLYEAENYVKVCMAYRWLYYKYPETFPYIDEVSENAKTANEYIEFSLNRYIAMNSRQLKNH